MRSTHLIFTVHCVTQPDCMTSRNHLCTEKSSCGFLYVVCLAISHVRYLNSASQNLGVLSNQSVLSRWCVTMVTKKATLITPPLGPMGPLCLSSVKSAFPSILLPQIQHCPEQSLVGFFDKSDIDLLYKYFQVIVFEGKNASLFLNSRQ